MTGNHAITTVEALESIYGTAGKGALAKETPRLTPAYRRWIESAPFFAIASSGPGGLDCSPRGDAAGQLLQVLDDGTLAVPDRRGNNRLDTLRNILADPRIALLFLVPGIDETLRINGRAAITTDPELIGRFEVGGKRPASVILVEIESVYFQCARALARAKLWDPDARRGRKDVPTAGQMLKGALPEFDAETYDAEMPGYLNANLY